MNISIRNSKQAIVIVLLALVAAYVGTTIAMRLNQPAQTGLGKVQPSGGSMYYLTGDNYRPCTC